MKISINSRRLLRKQRSRAKIFGTANRPRLSVFRSNRSIYAQLIDDQARHTVVAASLADVPRDKKATKSETARLVGEALARKAREKKIAKAVFHKSSYAFHGRVKALAEGARAGGLDF